jgi:hypothetical protein
MQSLVLNGTSLTSISNIESTALIIIAGIILIFAVIVSMAGISNSPELEPVSQPVQIGKFPFNRTVGEDIDFYTDLDTDCYPEVQATNHFQDINIFGDD